MTDLFLIFLSIIVLFFVLLFFQGRTKRKFCAICAAVSLSWVFFLVLFYLGYFSDLIILGILMGESAVGLYYLLEKRMGERFYLFRLPFLLTITFIFYLILKWSDEVLSIALLIGGLWFLFGFVYFYKNSKAFKGLVKNLINCCKNW